MPSPIRPLIAAPLAAGFVLSLASLSGCVVAVGNTSRPSTVTRANDVPSPLMGDIVTTTRSVTIGDTTHQVLDRYPPRLVSKFSAAEVDGRFVEEYRVLAYDRNNNTSFERWLYFVDGRLRAFDSERLEQHALAEILDPERRYDSTEMKPND